MGASIALLPGFFVMWREAFLAECELAPQPVAGLLIDFSSTVSSQSTAVELHVMPRG
ncbi:hypothetical protein ACKFKH_16130 [Phormidesmis sp. 146-20]